MGMQSPRVFIVDDHPGFSRSLARLVKSAGYEVETFLTAENFLHRDVYTGASCLLLDVRMPGVSGLDLQRILKERDSVIPIVFMSALADTTTRARAMRGGAVDMLLKPVEEEKLRDAIERALDIENRQEGLDDRQSE